MKQLITAKVYAHSLYELGAEMGVDVTGELTKFSELIATSNDLENVFFLDVFSASEKIDVFAQFSSKLNLSLLTVNTVHYLIEEKRLGLLPIIFKEMVVIDDDKKGFIRGVVEGYYKELDQDAIAKIKAYLKAKTHKEPILSYQQSNKISAGYKITAGDLQLDATIDSQLEKLIDNL